MTQTITCKDTELTDVNSKLAQKITAINNLIIKIQELEKFKNFSSICPWNNNQLKQSYNQLNQNNRIGFVECDSLDLDEKLIAVNFISGDSRIYFSVVCKDSTKFADVEKKLYENYPEYAQNDGLDNIFLGSGHQVNRFQTMAQNGFSGYSITLNNFNY